VASLTPVVVSAASAAAVAFTFALGGPDVKRVQTARDGRGKMTECASPPRQVSLQPVGAIGVVSLTLINGPRELPLAAVPLLFALQQSVEGLLWITLPTAPDAAIGEDLTVCFLAFAEVFWPIYSPLSVWPIEPGSIRRQFMLLCLAVGAGVSCVLLWSLLTRSHGTSILDDHIVYVTEGRHFSILSVGYLVASSLPLMLSSRPTLRARGIIVPVGSVVAHIVYWETFVSVWCFFAAAPSAVILCHFQSSRRRRPGSAGTW
jgi:hypothetical protein